MDIRKRPIGVELLGKGLINENDIDEVLVYQRKHPEKHFGEILYLLGIVPAKVVLQTITENTEYTPIVLSKSILKVMHLK